MLVHTRDHVTRTVGTMGPVTQPDGHAVAETVKVQDTALFAVGGWLNSYESVSHPALIGVEDERNHFGVVIGASVASRWPC